MEEVEVGVEVGEVAAEDVEVVEEDIDVFYCTFIKN